MADEKRDIFERALGRSGQFKKVRTDGTTIQVKPRPSEPQQFRRVREGEDR